MKCFNYWNDIEIEKTKPFWIEDPSDMKIIRYLKEETNLERCFHDAIDYADNLGKFKGSVLDVGAGVGWSSAIISKFSLIETVTVNDYSYHRINKIFPLVFKQVGGDNNKIKIVAGDFMRLKWKPESFDVVIFVQSLYMFQNLANVLNAVNKILVNEGL